MEWRYSFLSVEKGKLTDFWITNSRGIRLTKELKGFFIGIDIDIILGIFGDDRWEMVSVLGDPEKMQYLYLKRPTNR